MGYPVCYNGEIEITPALTEEDAAVVREFARGDRTDLTAPIFAAIAASDEPDLPYSCALYEVSEDRSALVPEEGESRHGLATWLTLLAKHFLKRSGYLLNGEVSWSAEQADDRGSVFIKDNLVEIVDDIIVNPGPDWAPEHYVDERLKTVLQELIDSADKTGCSPDLTVVSATAVEAIRTVLVRI